jgi:hypothetical protein
MCFEIRATEMVAGSRPESKVHAAKSEAPRVKSSLKAGGIATSPGSAAGAGEHQNHNEKLVRALRRGLVVKTKIKATPRSS